MFQVIHLEFLDNLKTYMDRGTSLSMSTFNLVANLHLHWHVKIKYKLPIPPNAFLHSFLELLLSTSLSHFLSFSMTLFSLYFSSLFNFFFHDKTNSPS